jgi:hypothetical protein
MLMTSFETALKEKKFVWPGPVMLPPIFSPKAIEVAPFVASEDPIDSKAKTIEKLRMFFIRNSFPLAGLDVMPLNFDRHGNDRSRWIELTI